MRLKAEALQRRDTIRQILDAEEITAQDDLLSQLESRGIKVTQSSVSRDLKAMHVVKSAGRYKAVSTSANFNPMAFQALSGSVQRTHAAGPNLLVVHTPPGQASLVAVAIDNAEWPEVVGTVAGDDTLFVATRGRADQRIIEARLSSVA